MRRALRVFALIVVVAAAGCGTSGSPADTAAAPQPVSRAQDFPTAEGMTLQSLREGLASGPILTPTTSSSLEVGTNRVGFALRDRADKLISGAAVALYTTDHDGTHVRGPYLARSESLAVDPRFASQGAGQGSQAATAIYVAQVPIGEPGKRVITGVARLDGRLVATTGFELSIPRRGLKGRPPEVGDQVTAIHTPTIASVGGDASKISTRVPPAAPMLEVDFASVVGRKPVVLVFATPALCRSRACGPVVDVALQVQSEYGDKVAFIQQEIYKDNSVAEGFNKQVTAWRLRTDPWTFVIGRDGRVAARFEGALSTSELERAVAGVARS